MLTLNSIPHIATNVSHRFPQYLREKVQSCLTLCWTFQVPIVQKASPAQLVAEVLQREIGPDIWKYTYVDFCAGAGGPTPFIEQDLNGKLAGEGDIVPSNEPSSPPSFYNSSVAAKEALTPRSPRTVNGDGSGSRTGGVKFILTDIHPHIPDWTEAAKKSANLSFVADSVDAANAPASLNGTDGRRIFRLYNLAFHHFEDNLGLDILRNTVETADAFGYVSFTLRTYTLPSIFVN